MKVETVRVRMAESGHECTINLDDFDDRLHAEVDIVAPAPKVPPVRDTRELDAAARLVVDSDGQTVDRRPDFAQKAQESTPQPAKVTKKKTAKKKVRGRKPRKVEANGNQE